MYMLVEIDCLSTPLSFSEFTALALALGNTPAGMCCGLSEHIHVHPHVLYTCGMLCTLVLSATCCGFNLPLVQFSGSLVLYFAIFCSVFPPSPFTSLYRFSFSLSLSLCPMRFILGSRTTMGTLPGTSPDTSNLQSWDRTIIYFYVVTYIVIII